MAAKSVYKIKPKVVNGLLANKAELQYTPAICPSCSYLKSVNHALHHDVGRLILATLFWLTFVTRPRVDVSHLLPMFDDRFTYISPRWRPHDLTVVALL